MPIEEVPIASLMRADWLDTQMRIAIRQGKVDQYAEEMADGSTFPPPIVFRDHNGRFHVGDGFHRILAHHANQKNRIACDVRDGGRLKAILCCIEANRKQRGMDWSTGDRRKAAITLLTDRETMKWSLTKIAETVGCTVSYVSLVSRQEKVVRPEQIQRSDGRLSPARAPGRKDGKAQLNERRNRIADKVSQGKTLREIAIEEGVNTATAARDAQAVKLNGQMVVCPHCNGSGFIAKQAG